MNWLLLGGSLVAIIALAATAHLLGLGKREPLTSDEAAERARFELAPASVVETFVGDDAMAALVRMDDGRLLLVRRHGNALASRLLTPPLAIRETAAGVVVDPADPMFGTVAMPLDISTRDRLRRLL